MKAKSSRQKTQVGTILAMLSLTLTALGLLFWSPGQTSHAQEPNRQLVQTGSANANGAKRIALVIGNGAYTKAPPLKNPPNDARDMAATLRTLGFDVTSGINTNQRDMKRLIREFGQKLKAGGSGLFYYAGHGVQSKGRNYLIPVDADIQSEAEVEDSGVDASLVLNYMDDAQNGLNIVILDACRNNPFARSFRSASEGLAQVDAPTGTLIAYATAPGRVASDGTGQNGLYTSELLKQMRVPGLSATEMFMRVRAEVMKQTGNKQVPWEASSLVGTFYFSGGRTNLNSSDNGSTSAPPLRISEAAKEEAFWEAAKDSSEPQDFRDYLAKYPSGAYADAAKIRLRRLESEKNSRPTNSSTTDREPSFPQEKPGCRSLGEGVDLVGTETVAGSSTRIMLHLVINNGIISGSLHYSAGLSPTYSIEGSCSDGSIVIKYANYENVGSRGVADPWVSTFTGDMDEWHVVTGRATYRYKSGAIIPAIWNLQKAR